MPQSSQARFFWSACIALCVVGCADRVSVWESTAAGEQAFVLNKITGDLYAVQDGALRPVLRDISRPWSGLDQSESEARANPLKKTQWIADDVVRVAVATKYRAGQVEIRGEITPCIDRMRTPNAGDVATLLFLDAEYFRVVDLGVDGSDLVTVQGLDGECAQFVFHKRGAVSAEDWRAASNLGVSWTDLVTNAAAAWAKANPKDAADRRDLASSERTEETLAEIAAMQRFLSQHAAKNKAPVATAPARTPDVDTSRPSAPD